MGKGHFVFGPKTVVRGEDERLVRVFTGYLRGKWKFDNRTGSSVVYLNSRGAESLPAEGYRLSITPDSIIVTGRGAGLFYGIQSLIQLFPNGSEAAAVLPCLTIEDWPRFRYRGFMLDVSRHFFTVGQVKELLDWMAFYKLNRFHWHLTDDQGWRLEIKSHPKLTSVGAWRVPRIEFGGNTLAPKPGEKATDGGFYTQEEVREIIRYAADRFIEIVPEVDVPGHSLAAIAAYPELSVTRDSSSKVNPGSTLATWFPQGGFKMHVDNALNPSDEKVYRFLDDVFGEVAALFPGKYIHIGGDECYKGYWEKDSAVQAFMHRSGIGNATALQAYFISRLDGIIRSKGKTLIGWDEICQGDSLGNETVMNRFGEKAAIAQIRQGRDIVLASHDGNSGLYFDYTQSTSDMEPSHHGSNAAPLWHSFLLDPEYGSLDKKHILGVEACLWTEYVSSADKMYYMTFPRLLGVSETGWSQQARKSWPSFAEKDLPVHLERFDKAGVNYRVPPATGYIDTVIETSSYTFVATTAVPGAKVYFTLDGSFPSEAAHLYTAPILIVAPAGKKVTLRTIVITPAGRRSIVTKAVIGEQVALVITTNQASKKIEIYDFAVSDWNSAEAIKYEWRPNDSANGWGLPSEARVRNSTFFGGQQLLVADSYGFCAIVPFPALTGKTWSINLGPHINPHAIELLPNGNVAIAASDGGFVRVYTSSQGPGSTGYASFRLLAAHAVLWDPAYNVLWVTGQYTTSKHILTALKIMGTAAAPVITEEMAYRSILPSPWGHDVQPYTGDVNKLLVSTNQGAHIYDKVTKAFREAPHDIGGLSGVKGISNLSSGRMALTRPDAGKAPLPFESCKLNGWSTSYVDFYSADGVYKLSRHRNGAAYYKGRFLNAEYQ
ncbi:MAG: family 20 glycosylhydrolase [Bacteroidetes bacterium]|nr:family 20 glycosylhydrolase [Bacteroidota bacterium]